MKEIVKDYLWTFELEGINNQVLFDTCSNVEKYIISTFGVPDNVHTYGCATSYHHTKFNLFSFPCIELQNFYIQLNKAIQKVVIPHRRYYIRCWVNLFRKGQHVNWHGHWPSDCETYHGFYCVNTEGENSSFTSYRIPYVDKEIVIDSKDGLLVFGKSENDQHKSSPWENEGRPRVTIAFDVIPWNKTMPHTNYDGLLLNNYIPMLTHDIQ
jgi:hypothetical protein